MKTVFLGSKNLNFWREEWSKHKDCSAARNYILALGRIIGQFEAVEEKSVEQLVSFSELGEEWNDLQSELGKYVLEKRKD